MKINLSGIFLFVWMLLLSSCIQVRRELSDLSVQRDTLQAITERQEAELSELQSYLEIMTRSLDSIAIVEGMLFLPDPERPNAPLSKKQLRVRLERFQELVDRQQAKIKELEDSLDLSNTALSNMKSLISYFRTNIEKKDAEIDNMKKTLLVKEASIKKLESEVSTLQENVTDLQNVNEQQQVIMDVQDEILNEGYYIVKTRKELLAMGIRSANISNADLDLSLFTKVDIRKLSGMNINSPRVKIITPMPSESYTLTKNIDGSTLLSILSPADFWQFSNILIIQTR